MLDMEHIKKFALFCSVCDWAIDKACIEQSRIDGDCPGCGCRKMSEFGELKDREPSDPADWWKEVVE